MDIAKRDPREIGARLRELRGVLGHPGRSKTQQEMIELCKLTSSNRWSNWERGESMPDLSAGFAICETIGFGLNWLYYGEESDLPTALARVFTEYRSKMGTTEG